MEKFVKTFFKWQSILCLVAALCLLSCNDKDEDKTDIPPYDPSKPLVLTDFYPNTGPMATQVILEGGNFGNNAEDVKVWFNEKPAAVISTKGTRMLVLAPRLPGEECTISVKIGADSTGYANEIFDYIIQTSVVTLAGGDTGAKNMPTGTSQLSTAQFNSKPGSTLSVDADDNLLIPFGVGSSYYFYIANEESDMLKLLKDDANFIVGGYMGGYDPGSGNFYWRMINGTGNGLNYFDHRAEYASVSAGNIGWDTPMTGTGMAEWGTFRVMTVRPSDGKFYMRGNQGQFARFDPDSARGENIGARIGRAVPSDGGDAYGLVFDPRDDNILYFSIDSRHCIYKYDLTNDTFSVFAGRENNGGYLDGELAYARFNNPSQMCVDPEGNLIYVADRDNHCIRMISLETGYVSTVAGMPQQAGYLNGTAETSKFNKPLGLAINSYGILYIGDTENHAIRRLAIE